MATNYTTNYGLCQWEPEDNFLREEFNQDNAKIDEALAAKADSADMNSQVAALEARISTLESRVDVESGTYTGDGAASKYISLSFQPRAVLVEHRNGVRHDSGLMAAEGGLAVTGSDLKSTTSSWDINALRISGSGFYVSGELGSNLNTASQVYHYLAFR